VTAKNNAYSLISLTVLASSINNNPEGGAHAKLSKLSPLLLSHVDEDKPEVDLVLDGVANILDGVANILVRNSEVVAACNKAYHISHNVCMYCLVVNSTTVDYSAFWCVL
jgi:hypothetical protein